VVGRSVVGNVDGDVEWLDLGDKGFEASAQRLRMVVGGYADG
jgi:hypothetical protein